MDAFADSPTSQALGALQALRAGAGLKPPTLADEQSHASTHDALPPSNKQVHTADYASDEVSLISSKVLFGIVATGANQGRLDELATAFPECQNLIIGRYAPAQLDLAKFTQLTVLHVDQASALESLTNLPTTLKRLVIAGRSKLEINLRACRGVEVVLSMVEVIGSLDVLEFLFGRTQHPQIAELTLEGDCGAHLDLGLFPSVAALELHDTDIECLDAMKHATLTKLIVSSSPNLESIIVRNCSALRHLELGSLPSLDPILGLETLHLAYSEVTTCPEPLKARVVRRRPTPGPVDVVDQYIEGIRRGAWGDDVELFACTQLYPVTLHKYREITAEPLKLHTSDELAFGHKLLTGETDNADIRHVGSMDPDDQRVDLHILNHSEHYAIIKPIAETSRYTVQDMPPDGSCWAWCVKIGLNRPETIAQIRNQVADHIAGDPELRMLIAAQIVAEGMPLDTIAARRSV